MHDFNNFLLSNVQYSYGHSSGRRNNSNGTSRRYNHGHHRHVNEIDWTYEIERDRERDLIDRQYIDRYDMRDMRTRRSRTRTHYPEM